MRLPAARRTAVRVGSILGALAAVGAMALAGGPAAPAAATDPPSWASLTASASVNHLLPRLLTGSPSGSAAPSPSTAASPTPTPGESERPDGSDKPEEPGSDGSGDAKPNGVDLAVTVTGPRVDVGPAGTSMRVDLRNTGKANARDVRLTIDATRLAATIGVALPSEGCATDPRSQGRKVTCAYPGGALAAGASDSPVTFFLMPEPGLAPAPGGTVTVSVTSGASDANPQDNTVTTRVRIVESAVDLVAQVSDVTDLAPGQTATLAFVVANQGTETARGMTLEFTLPPYASFVDDYQTCTYTVDRRRMVCDLATVTLAQDQALTADDFDPIRIRVAPDAPGPASLGRGSLTVTTLGQTTPLIERGDGPVLRTIATRSRPMASVWPRGADTTGHTTSFGVSVTHNPADLVVAPGRGSGAVGDVVRVQITVTNNGPADAVGGFRATIDAPSGTEIVGVPPECRELLPGRRYECVVPHQIEVGAAQVGQVNLRITGKKVGNDSTVVVHRPDGMPGADVTPANNRTTITVTVSGGEGGGAWLPVTGSQVNVMALGGVALLVVGFGLYVAGHRRRSHDLTAAGEAPADGQVAENPPSTQTS